jgi:hypothetical protein
MIAAVTDRRDGFVVVERLKAIDDYTRRVAEGYLPTQVLPALKQLFQKRNDAGSEDTPGI